MLIVDGEACCVREYNLLEGSTATVAGKGAGRNGVGDERSLLEVVCFYFSLILTLTHTNIHNTCTHRHDTSNMNLILLFEGSKWRCSGKWR